MYTTARSPPPLQHPRPQHPPSQIPSTSPPPPSDFSDSDSSYQRFSSPPAVSPAHMTMRGATGYASTPDSYIPAGGGNGMAYAASHSQPGAQGFFSSQSAGAGMGQGVPAWMNVGGGGAGAAGAAQGGIGGIWPGMSDPTTAMGVQFGAQALSAGTAYIDSTVSRLLPLAHLKHSFNVSNGYVVKKLGVVLWPWRHKPWSRGVRRSETTGVVEGYRPPREDINCPDLYIPVMGLTTYMLLSAIVAGSQGQFDPRILGQTASKSFGLLLVEFACIKLGCYLLGIGEEGTFVDLVSYEGYKFVGIIVTLLSGLLGASGYLYLFIFIYTVLANFFFLLRSLRHLVLPDPTMSPLQDTATTTPVVSHGQRSRRIQFLFMIAASQGLSMGLLVRV